MNSKLKIPLIALGVLWFISLAGYLITSQEDEQYPIIMGDVKCNEIYDGDKLIERNCRARDSEPSRIRSSSTGDVAGTGSMSPSFDKGDLMYYKDVTENELLWLDSVYVYRVNETKTTIHRLVHTYIGEGGIEYFIFKGDNNPSVDEPITRDQVEKLLIGTCYKEGRGLCT